MSQKGFIPRVDFLSEHISLANMTINRAMTERKTLYILTLDMPDSFCSVFQPQLYSNISKICLSPILYNVTMHSYVNANVKSITLNGTTNEINITREAKQGCPLSPFYCIFILIF
jgi:hypothetical protein